MESNAAPNAPARAATLPPPGVGEEEANSFKKLFTFFSINIDTLHLVYFNMILTKKYLKQY